MRALSVSFVDLKAGLAKLQLPDLLHEAVSRFFEYGLSDLEVAAELMPDLGACFSGDTSKHKISAADRNVAVARRFIIVGGMPNRRADYDSAPDEQTALPGSW